MTSPLVDFSIKAHDRLPAIVATLLQPDPADPTGLTLIPIDLTNATSVKFIMRPLAGGVVKVSAAAVVVTALAGVVRYDWLAVDTDTPGVFQAEWEITWPGPKKQTVPTTTYHSIAVLADLDNL